MENGIFYIPEGIARFCMVLMAALLLKSLSPRGRLERLTGCVIDRVPFGRQDVSEPQQSQTLP
jgi:hypothetical protein